MQYFHRHWDEVRGDSHNDWGTSDWYFEVGVEMIVTRQIEIYANGTVLHYDGRHMQDEFGSLAEKPLDADDFAPFKIEQSEFERIWSSQKPFNR